MPKKGTPTKSIIKYQQMVTILTGHKKALLGNAGSLHELCRISGKPFFCIGTKPKTIRGGVTSVIPILRFLHTFA
jgi:hypothetical protein